MPLILKACLALTVCLTMLNQSPQSRNKTGTLTTNTYSQEFAKVEARLNFLQTYLNFQSNVLDAQYHIVYYDNSKGFVPAPSDWDMRILLWLEPKNVHLWLKDMTEVTDAGDFSWITDLDPELSPLLSNARYFESSGKHAALLDEGLLALWYLTF